MRVCEPPPYQRPWRTLTSLFGGSNIRARNLRSTKIGNQHRLTPAACRLATVVGELSLYVCPRRRKEGAASVSLSHYCSDRSSPRRKLLNECKLISFATIEAFEVRCVWTDSQWKQQSFGDRRSAESHPRQIGGIPGCLWSVAIGDARKVGVTNCG